MAFQDVSARNFVNLKNTLKVGEAYEGYVVKFTTSKLKDKDVTNIVMQNAASGETETLGAQGNLRYMVEDGKIETGQLTRITRIADKKVGGLMSSQFRVEQDPEDVLSDEQFEKIESADLSSPSPARVDKKALASEKVKREAEALAAQATKRG